MNYFQEGKFMLTIRLTMLLLNRDYLLSSVEAEVINGNIIWSKNEKNFVKISSIDSFDKINKERFLISRKIETHNFNGTRLRLASFPIENLINFVENNTLITGVYGEMWLLLSEMFNFKIEIIKFDKNEYGSRSENGSWDGLLGCIYRNETDIIPRSSINPKRSNAMDFTMATWMSSYRFYMKKQLEYQKTWMTDLFSMGLWFSIVGLFFALTFSNYFIHALSNLRKKKQGDFVPDLKDHFFYIFSIFCNQGWTPRQLEKRSKILIFSTRLFTWLMVMAFSSKLISHIAEKKFHPPFEDLKSFMENTDYKLIVKGNSLVYSNFKTSREPIYKTIIDSGRLIQSNTKDACRKICTGNYVYLESQDVMEADNSKICETTFIKKPYFTTWVAGGVGRGFEYKRTIDLGILKLYEFGIIKRLKFKWLKKRTSMITTPYKSTESISIKHVYLIFAILLFAMILSFVILIIENIL